LRLGEKIDPGRSLTGAQRGGGIVEEAGGPGTRNRLPLRSLDMACSMRQIVRATGRADRAQ